MLAGINLQPGAWDATKGELDDVFISDIAMTNVTTPFHFMMKPGNTAGRITVTRASATGVYRRPARSESWAETPFKDVVFRDVDIEFEGGGAADRSRARSSPPAWTLDRFPPGASTPATWSGSCWRTFA